MERKITKDGGYKLKAGQKVTPVVPAGESRRNETPNELEKRTGARNFRFEIPDGVKPYPADKKSKRGL